MRRIAEKLREGEEVEYGFLGVVPNPTPEPSAKGVRISGVQEGSPAQRAGLKAHDWVLSINGQPIRDSDDLFLQIGIHLAGTTVRIEAASSPVGLRRTCTAKLAKFLVPGPIVASRKPPAKGGLRVDYTSILGQRPGAHFFVQRIPDGVAIREVVPGSPADAARLQADKVITHVNDQRVSSPAEYYQAVARAGNRIVLKFLTSEGREDRVSLEAQ
jgi:S1-C subfamily serine protease